MKKTAELDLSVFSPLVQAKCLNAFGYAAYDLPRAAPARAYGRVLSFSWYCL